MATQSQSGEEKSSNPMMDVRQCAEYLGISSDTLYQYASSGIVPAFKLGNRWRFVRSVVDKWMIDQCSAGDNHEQAAD